MFARQVIIFKGSIRFWQRPCEVNSGSGLVHLYTITRRFNFVNQYRLYEEKMPCRDSVTVEKRVSKKTRHSWMWSFSCDFHVRWGGVWRKGNAFQEGIATISNVDFIRMGFWSQFLGAKSWAKLKWGTVWWSFFFFFFSIFLMLLSIGSCFSPVKNSNIKQGKFWYQAPALKFNFLGSGSWIWKAKPARQPLVPLVPLVSLSCQGARRTCLGWRTASLAARKVVPLRQPFYMAVWSSKDGSCMIDRPTMLRISNWWITFSIGWVYWSRALFETVWCCQGGRSNHTFDQKSSEP